MDILIKNMEMPRGCVGCTFDKVTYTPRRIGKDTYSSYEWHECFVAKKDCTRIVKSGKKPKWCPLVPVPEHGDLIDRDAVLNELKKYYKVGEIAEVGEVACFISDAEVVLEASR